MSPYKALKEPFQSLPEDTQGIESLMLAQSGTNERVHYKALQGFASLYGGSTRNVQKLQRFLFAATPEVLKGMQGGSWVAGSP